MRFSRRTFALASAASPLLAHGIAHAQSATPTESGDDTARDRLTDMLQYVPGGHLDGVLDMSWNDYQRQGAAVRATNGDAVAEGTDGELAMTSHYAAIPHFLSYAQMLPDFAGYSMDNVMQSVSFGGPPNVGLVMRINVDPLSLIPFWESLDYEEKENEHGTFWTIGEEGELDLTNPIQQMVLAHFNNIAVLNENTLAYAPTSEMLAQLQATAMGESANAVAGLEPMLAALPEDATSAWFLDGEILMFEGLIAAQLQSEESLKQLDQVFAESDDAAGNMPVLRTLCIGITAGATIGTDLHNPQSQDFIILETDALDMAAQAVDVITWRVENLQSVVSGEPYSELLPNLATEEIATELVRCSRTLDKAPPRFSQMILAGDVLPFAYRIGS